MEPVISISEIVEKREEPGGVREVCATIESHYDKAQHQLIAELGGYLQLDGAEARVHPKWLPAAQTLREHVERGEASDLARDIFHRWVRRVREAVPRTEPLPLE